MKAGAEPNFTPQLKCDEDAVFFSSEPKEELDDYSPLAERRSPCRDERVISPFEVLQIAQRQPPSDILDSELSFAPQFITKHAIKASSFKVPQIACYLYDLKQQGRLFKSFAEIQKGFMEKLEELYLASNQITALSGWESLPQLRILHLRRNKIEKIEGGGETELPPLESLQAINLRSNKIASKDAVKNLFQFPNLTDINVINNPVDQNETSFNMLLADMLIKRPQLKRFCKTVIEESHLLEAVYLARYRHEKEEAERKKREAEEAARAAAEEN